MYIYKTLNKACCPPRALHVRSLLKLANGELNEGRKGACLCVFLRQGRMPAHPAFEMRKTHLDRIVIRGVWWQILDPDAGGGAKIPKFL